MPKATKRFRICSEGATTDGREISRDWIEQMAATYDPKVYGARINMEHIKGYYPDSPFRMYGDVTAVYAEEIADGALKGKLALYADIDPTPDLVSLVKARQKVYTSIEVNPSFSDTGKAYLIGLAVTDSPASLGTEYLQFSAKAQQNPLASRKQDAGNLFTVAEETAFEFEEEKPAAPSLFSRVKQLLSSKSTSDDLRFKDVHDAVEVVVDHVETGLKASDEKLSALEKFLTERLSSLEKTTLEDREKFNTLKGKLETSASQNYTQRPVSTGGNKGDAAAITDC
ncbi:MAG: GPO family capsid scaffolding protein [Rouxiella aceris]|uniref:GPO family capsid scaffolding protein n=1 Tax=Rouxiella aceris TaxID=2703884 RepID=UPI0028414459|nr:GPO family capsid scaffolding protein [Rouxiella aceris]MDR3434657.1 GPO family capsid scaffolding protein [Rouxiella aceris]